MRPSSFHPQCRRCPHRRTVLPLVLLLLLAAPIFAQPRPDAPPAPPATMPAGEPLARADLIGMYRRELSDDFKPELGEPLAAAHILVEDYFATTDPARRADIVKRLEATKLDPNLVGRIARIRIHWPDLKGGVYYVNERVGPHSVIYFLGVPPEYDRRRPWPLVIKLPGSHAFLTKPPPSSEDVVAFYTTWINQELASHPDALVLMPLLNLDEGWGPGYKGMNNVIQPMLHAAGRVNIDPRRVHLIGHSMAAHGIWNLSVHYPTWFASFSALAGGMVSDFQRLRLDNLRNLYVLVWHDAEDPVVKVEHSRALVARLRQLKYDVDYEETRGVGHAPTDEIAERLYQKMRARARDVDPPEVVVSSNRPDSLFNRVDWVQIYQALNTGGDQRVRFQRSGQAITLHASSCRVAAAITAPNRIEVKSLNVQSLRLYLNDQMVRFDRPLTVVVNGRVRYEGPIKGDYDTLLRDQVFLGRGWRCYTAFIDIDFGANPIATTNPATPPSPATRPARPTR